MGQASRRKRELREMVMEDLPERLQFGPEFLRREPEVRIEAGLASAHGSIDPEPTEGEPDGLD